MKKKGTRFVATPAEDWGVWRIDDHDYVEMNDEELQSAYRGRSRQDTVSRNRCKHGTPSNLFCFACDT
jgi:hypothetical protein